MPSTQQRWNAEDYARNSQAQFQWAQELVSKLGLRGSEVILDIGCGDGRITALLAQAVTNGNVLGIDSSEDMIQHASKQFPLSRCPNLSFLHMDATNICLPAQFDIAFSNAALHWVENHIAVLRGVRSCLKGGGRILFQMGGRGNARGMFTAIETVISEPRWQPYYQGFLPPYHFYGPEDYEAWLPESGFRPARVELIPKDMRHQGVEGLTGWLRTTWFPYTDCLPEELRDVFLAEVTKVYTEQHPIDASGCTHVRMVRLEVEAYAP